MSPLADLTERLRDSRTPADPVHIAAVLVEIALDHGWIESSEELGDWFETLAFEVGSARLRRLGIHLGDLR